VKKHNTEQSGTTVCLNVQTYTSIHPATNARKQNATHITYENPTLFGSLVPSLRGYETNVYRSETLVRNLHYPY
jgi:hypothetical protein